MMANRSSLLVNDNPGGGMAIVNLGLEGGIATYCCGSPVSNSTGGLSCAHGEAPFTIETGTILFGRAALASAPGCGASTLSRNSTVSACTSPATASTKADQGANYTSVDSSKQLAVGLGVGVPLALTTGAAMLWAWLERSRRKREHQIGVEMISAQDQLRKTMMEQQGIQPPELDSRCMPVEAYAHFSGPVELDPRSTNY